MNRWHTRGLALLLTGALLCSLTAGCGAQDAPSQDSGATVSSVAPQEQTSSDGAGKPAEESPSDSEGSSSLPASSADGSQQTAAPGQDASSEETAVPSEEAPPAERASSEEGEEVSSSTTANPKTGLPLQEEASVPPATPKTPTYHVYTPQASGTKVLGNSSVTIDASNLAEGYVMIKYLGSNPKVKIQITRKNGTTYNYDVKSAGNYETFSFPQGSGSYTIGVFENLSGTSYVQACTETVDVQLRSSVLPFLYPNQYVNFTASSQAVLKGGELASTASSDLGIVENVYNYVITNVSYDYDKANQIVANRVTGYLPSVDSTLSTGKAICFDYGALMAAMLRSQGIPTQLVVGYAGDVYHAWLNVYLDEVGWVNGIIYFDGKSWVRMDPTFASSGGGSDDIMKYIGDGSHYSPMYIY